VIAIIDYGLGNLGSIQNICRKLGAEATLTNDAAVIMEADKIILPGVGSFDAGMGNLRTLGLEPVLNKKVLVEKTPVLGICLGAQLMTKSSEEGVEAGLGWFDAHTKKFNLVDVSGKWPLPNIGWRDVEIHNNYGLLDSIEDVPRFYFVHNFYMEVKHRNIVSLTSRYGVEFVCGLHKENIHCVQFHPEKSHRFGLEFFKKFIKL
jgi:imidazole glycerol-phosphate synthase subunit HisH